MSVFHSIGLMIATCCLPYRILENEILYLLQLGRLPSVPPSTSNHAFFIGITEK